MSLHNVPDELAQRVAACGIALGEPLKPRHWPGITKVSTSRFFAAMYGDTPCLAEFWYGDICECMVCCVYLCPDFGPTIRFMELHDGRPTWDKFGI